MAIFVVENERANLKSMKDLDHLNYSINQHMKRIKENLDGEKIMQLFQMLSEYSVKHSGMSFMNNKTMAKNLNVSVRTIQRYTKKLEQLHILLKVPTRRKKNRGQTSNTYVILPVIKSVVSRVCHGVCHTLNPSLKPFKQESNINIADIELLKKYADYKINDIVHNGKSITYLSSYINKFFKSLERQAKFKAEASKRKQEQKDNHLEEQPYQRKIDYDLLKKMMGH